jgi:hypothetical protein
MRFKTGVKIFFEEITGIRSQTPERGHAGLFAKVEGARHLWSGPRNAKKKPKNAN